MGYMHCPLFYYTALALGDGSIAKWSVYLSVCLAISLKRDGHGNSKFCVNICSHDTTTKFCVITKLGETELFYGSSMSNILREQSYRDDFLGIPM